MIEVVSGQRDSLPPVAVRLDPSRTWTRGSCRSETSWARATSPGYLRL